MSEETLSKKIKWKKMSFFCINTISISIYIYDYRCISINLNVEEKLIYFSNSSQIVKLMY